MCCCTTFTLSKFRVELKTLKSEHFSLSDVVIIEWISMHQLYEELFKRNTFKKKKSKLIDKWKNTIIKQTRQKSKLKIQ